MTNPTVSSTQDALIAAVITAKDRFELWAQVARLMPSQSAIELGVFRGEFASHILGNCPSIAKYYMIDPWRHLDDWNKPANKSDLEFMDIKQEALTKTKFAETRRVVLTGKTTEVSNAIPERSVDFVYIDGDHTLKGITTDLIRMWPKLKDGGILAGDDFCESIWQHATQFEPSFIFPMAVHFAEAMDCIVYGLPFNQFAIIVNHSPSSTFEFRDLTGKYPSTSVRDVLQRKGRKNEYTKFQSLYGDFRLEEDCRNYQISGLHKESGRIRGEIVKTLKDISEPLSRVLLPGENNLVKQTYCDLFDVSDDRIITAGLNEHVDYRWDFEEAPPEFGTFDCIISQAMLEHLIDPYKHLRDLSSALDVGGYMIIHTVIPGFDYHRYPIDCMRFFPDWFEEMSDRLELEICDKYIGELRIMYKFRKGLG